MLTSAPILALALLAFGASAQPLRLEPVKVAESVYAFVGEMGEPTVGNRGHVGNAGFIVGEDGVIVVDTGISYRHGQAMLDAIARVSPRPVRLVIITHAVQEFVFGSAAFEERGIPLLAHTKSGELMRSRCAHCLESLFTLLGKDFMAGSRLVLPSQTVDGTRELLVAGRAVRLLHFGWAATPGDLAVYDQVSGVLFAGGLVDNQRIPELRDGKLAGWVAALVELERLPIAVLVPGHGPVAGKDAIAETRGYLLALDARVREVYRAGTSLVEAVDEADLPQYRDWTMYPALHRRNAHQRYLELELEELDTTTEH